jgi:hypothetical protein
VIRHVVLFRFRRDVSAERLAMFDAAVRALPGAIPAIASAVAGPALGLQRDGLDYVLMLDFVDREAFQAYKAHPAHRGLIDDHIRPCVAESVRAQVQV